MTSTYGRDAELKTIVEENCKPYNIPVQYVNKTAATLGNLFSNLKFVSLGKKHGISKPCTQPRCKTCHLMSGKEEITNCKNQTFKTGLGNCKTKNCIYCANCKLCGKPYVGKSTQAEHSRIRGHRTDMKKYMNNPQVADNDEGNDKDRYSLAIHLHREHGIQSIQGLDDYYEFTLLEKCTPKSIDLKEHTWIQRMKSLAPFGLNLNSPLGFPLINIG